MHTIANDAAQMRTYVALRRTRVRDGVKHLPRPKIVQDVLHIGTKKECRI